jgi:signal transduction histidine kinase
MHERTPTSSRTLPDPIPWTGSYWIVILLALCIGLLAVLFSLTIDRVLNGEFRHIFASDWFEALGATILSGIALLRIQARRRELMVRMQIVEDVNHHVRNALTAIVFSASLRDDPELDAQVKDACARIDWVLSDVLSRSVNGAHTDLPAHPAWRAGREL